MNRTAASFLLGVLPFAGFFGAWSVGALPAPSMSTPSADPGLERSAHPAPLHGARSDDPTWWSDIRPLLVENCMGCHGAEGPGWSMVDPTETYERHRMIAAMVTERLMPPWIAESGHQEYVGDRSLTSEQVETVRRWRDADFPAGTPPASGDVPWPEPHEAGAAANGHGSFEPELSLDVLPEGQYLPNQDAPDDYRCFVVDWPETEDRYVTGFRAAPGNLQVAHHVVIHAIAPNMVERFRELDQAEEGSGYQCFGGAVPDRLGQRAEREAYEQEYPDGVQELSAANFWLAHWAPGMDGHVFPQGTGIPVAPGSAMVVQMHYYGRDAPGQADAGSRIEFQLADRVERPAFHLAQTRNDWLGSAQNESMVIDPGQTATWEVADRLEPLLPYIGRITGIDPESVEALEIHSANLHMHAFGHSGRITLRHPTGQKETLLSVPRWDLRWQRDFTFVEPKVFERDEFEDVVLATECTFRNPTTEPVYGGFGSYDEMCFNFSYIAVRARGSDPVTDAGGGAR